MVLDPTLQRAQVGYALGRSFGSAVERNRLRRQLRAIVKQAGESLPAGVFVFGASPKAKCVSFPVLEEAMAGLIGRIRGIAASGAHQAAGGR